MKGCVSSQASPCSPSPSDPRFLLGVGLDSGEGGLYRYLVQIKTQQVLQICSSSSQTSVCKTLGLKLPGAAGSWGCGDSEEGEKKEQEGERVQGLNLEKNPSQPVSSRSRG